MRAADAEEARTSERQRDRRRFASASMEIDGLFNPGAKHQIEHKEWVAVAREDERESGSGPLDFDSGTVHMYRQPGRS